MTYLERAEKLEREAKSLRNLHALEEEAKNLIAMGRHIVDLDADKVAEVTGLSNGSIDFSANYLDGSYSRGYNFVVRNWRLATPEEVASALATNEIPSVEKIVAELQKIIPEENFRQQPEHATGVILQLEAKYRLNTVDLSTALYNDGIEEDDLNNWFDAFDTFLLFGGDEEDINKQPKKVGGEMEKKVEIIENDRFVVTYRDEETLERLKAMGIISYLPDLHEQLKFLFVNSTLTLDELEAIDGVMKVRKPRIGKLCHGGLNEWQG